MPATGWTTSSSRSSVSRSPPPPPPPSPPRSRRLRSRNRRPRRPPRPSPSSSLGVVVVAVVGCCRPGSGRPAGRRSSDLPSCCAPLGLPCDPASALVRCLGRPSCLFCSVLGLARRRRCAGLAGGAATLAALLGLLVGVGCSARQASVVGCRASVGASAAGAASLGASLGGRRGAAVGLAAALTDGGDQARSCAFRTRPRRRSPWPGRAARAAPGWSASAARSPEATSAVGRGFRGAASADGRVWLPREMKCLKSRCSAAQRFRCCHQP